MKGLCSSAAVTLLALGSSWGCAGDGTGLDEFGNPITGSLAALGPTLSGVQDNIFTPICTQCHTGASAPLGLALDEGVARANLVGVESTETPGLLRVDPGSPDSSYIIWKVEGRPDIVGGRMPLGMAPLSIEQLDALRGWIAAGAGAN
jgi:hypothetical protein